MVYSRFRVGLSSHRSRLVAGVALLTVVWFSAYGLPTFLASSPSTRMGPGSTAGAPAWPWAHASTGAEVSHGATLQPAPLEQVRAMVLERGVLKGTQVAGSWSVGSDGQPHPSGALRERFEYYLLGLGDATPAELRALISAEAEAALGAKAAHAVMDLFDRYWALRMHQPRYRMSVDDRRTWPAAFEEQKALRRQYLGADWAQAFFHDEEALFEQTLASADAPSGQTPSADQGGGPVPDVPPGADPTAVHAQRQALYGEAAAQRLAQLDVQWANWERRLDEAKALQRSLSAASDLSEVQRRQKWEAHLRSHFDQSEQARVQGLLGSP